MKPGGHGRTSSHNARARHVDHGDVVTRTETVWAEDPETAGVWRAVAMTVSSSSGSSLGMIRSGRRVASSPGRVRYATRLWRRTCEKRMPALTSARPVLYVIRDGRKAKGS